MKKIAKHAIAIVVSISLSMVLLTFFGCDSNKNKVIPLTDIVELSPSTITSITVSEYDRKPTDIADAKQIKEICSFLSNITINGKYTEEQSNKSVNGGNGGDSNFYITYSNKTSCYIRTYTDSKVLKINGTIKNGEIKGKSNVYPLTDASQVKNVKDYIHMQPAQ